MPRTRTPDSPAGRIPAELRDLGHPMWRSPRLFASWLQRHRLDALPTETITAMTWARRFAVGRDLWALQNDYVTGPSATRVDHDRLADAGVPWCGSLTRAVATAEAGAADPEAFRQECQLVPYGPTPDRRPTIQSR